MKIFDDQDDTEIKNFDTNLKDYNCDCDNVVCAKSASDLSGGDTKRVVMEFVPDKFTCEHMNTIPKLLKVYKELIQGAKCLLEDFNLIYFDYNPKI